MISRQEINHVEDQADRDASLFDLLKCIFFTVGEVGRIYTKRPGSQFQGVSAPRTGFEPVTYRLTAGRSTVELSRTVHSTNTRSIHQTTKTSQ